ELWHAIVLGVVQGLTEFLPISSSGHLVLTRELLPGMDEENSDANIMFAVAVHVGTLFSVLIYFHKRILELIRGMFKKPVSAEHRVAFFIVIASVPAVVAALTLKPYFEQAFDSPYFTSWMLIVTGALLVLPRFIKIKPKADNPEGEVTLLGAIVMGIGQAVAILPGISRSGSTIASGMLAGVNPSKAAEFSFLMAIPVIAGGAVFEFKDLEVVPPGMWLNCGIGAAVAFVTGLFAVYWVLDSIRRGKFEYFALYCVLVGIGGIVYFGFVKS
ncbi:MAG: undecaprenyl-diphosphate phosphatase, partial [Verrucomicrobiota bacterium]